jgi:L-lactate dehydrogenase
MATTPISQDAAVVLITAGVNEKTGGATNRKDPAGRLRLLDKNADAYRQIVPRVHEAAPDSVIVVVTDPPDPLADLVRKLGHERCHQHRDLPRQPAVSPSHRAQARVNPAQVEAQVLGEHGTSEVFVWSSARVGGRLARRPPGRRTTLDESSSRRCGSRTSPSSRAREASALGIGVVSARIAEMIIRDERSVIPWGPGTPSTESRSRSPRLSVAGGVVRRMPPDLSATEQQALQKSAETLRAAVARLGI